MTDISVSSSVGLDENGNIQFSIFPNPSNGIFNITLNEATIEDVTFSIFDITGRLVYLNDDIDRNVFTINISDKANGTYLLRILVGDKYSQIRIMKNN